jgi:hypothetical protein
MSMILAGASQPNGVKGLFIVFCAPLLLVVLFHGRTLPLKDGQVNAY